MQGNTKKTEIKYQQQVKVLEARTRLEQAKQVENFKKQLEEKDRKYRDLEQTKAQEKARIATETAQKAAQATLAQKVVNYVAPTAQAATGDAKAFIYAKESGNNPGAINRSSGACGLGQALPCSKMPCSLSDYACQDTFFTQYMLDRYGTWENARAFWNLHRWW